MNRNIAFGRIIKWAAASTAFCMLAGILCGCDRSAGMDFTQAKNPGELPYVFAKTEIYQNHLEIDGQWGKGTFTGDGSYGIGDPFVLRFDGRYYLYPSSGDHQGNQQGVKVFVSDDLVHWTDKGFAAKGPEVERAFAPEVLYYDGAFYMTESQAGSGHYVLKSDSPLGPFKPVTKQFGRNIDGSFYVCDDGRILFLYPDTGGIHIAPMDEKTMLPQVEKKMVSSLNGWCEGPGLFRRNGFLYLTYTGNSVISDGYRVGYSYQNGNDPLGDFVLPEQNILLLQTDAKGFRGLGHSCNVIGPDLDSYYLAYHCLISTAGPQRRYMLDQAFTNGGQMLMNGPAKQGSPIPKRPDFELRGTKGAVFQEEACFSEQQAEACMTAEWNFVPDGAPLSFYFAYEDAKNHFRIDLNQEGTAISLHQVKSGKDQLLKQEACALAPKKLHNLRLEAGADMLFVSLDSMRKLSLTGLQGKAGRIGVSAAAQVSYWAFSNEVFGTGDFETVKQVPGSFPAVHYLKKENRGFAIAHAEVKQDGARQGEKEQTQKDADGGFAVLLDTPGDWIKYPISVEEDSFYLLSARMSTESAGARVQAIVDEQEVYTFTIPENGLAGETDFADSRVGEFPLKAGQHTLKLRLLTGKTGLKTISLAKSNPTALTYENPLNAINETGWNYIGNWKIRQNAHEARPGDQAFAYAGSEKLTDFSVQVEVALTESASLYDGGLLLRAKNHALQSGQVAESLQGYYLSVTNNQLTLNKYNYGLELLDLAEVDWKQNDYHKLRVELRNNRITVFTDDAKEPVIDFFDDDAWLSGGFALCSYRAGISFRNIQIEQ